MNSKSIKAMLCLFALCFAVIGCTGKKSQQTSTLRLQLPDFKNRSASLGNINAFDITTASMNTIIINITGSGMAPIYWSWDNHGGSSTPPASLELSVARGTGRLIQVLAVMDNEDTGSMAFFYGDYAFNADVDVVDAPVSISAIGSLTGGEGRISGRILDSNGNGPTGKLRYRFNPPGGRPTMTVMETEIFAGWFDVFALQSGAFKYELENGNSLFPGLGEVSATNEALLQPVSSSAEKMRIMVPAHYYNKWDSATNSSTSRGGRPSTRLVLGYFGPGAAGKKVCYKTSTAAANNYLEGAYVSADINDSTKMRWVGVNEPSGSDAAAQSWIESVNSNRGGEGTATGACSGTLYADYLTADYKVLSQHEGILGFQGPFAAKGNNSWDGRPYFVGGSYDTATSKLTLSWKYLPGINDNVFTGVEVFYRQDLASGSHGDAWRVNDGVDCANLASKHGFTSGGEIPVGTESAQISVEPTNYAANKVRAYICPYRLDGNNNRIHLSAAAEYYSSGGGGGGGGGGGPTLPNATKLLVKGPTGSTAGSSIFNSVCTPLEIFGVDDANAEAYVNNKTITLTSSSGGVDTFYSSENCQSGDEITSFNMWGSGGRFVYVKRVTSGSTNHSFTASATGLASATHALAGADATAANLVKVMGSTPMVAHKCYPVTFQTRYVSGGVETVSKYMSSFYLNVPSVANLQFYEGHDQECTGAQLVPGTHSIQMGGTGDLKVTQTRYVKYVGNGTSFSFTPTIMTGSFGSGTLGTLNVSVTQPAAIAKMWISMNNPIPEGRCDKVRIELQDVNGNPSPATANTSITLATTRGTFYSNNTCSTSTTTAMVGNGQTYGFVYYKATSQGSATVTATQSTLNLSQSVNTTIGAPTAVKIVLKVDVDQSFTAGTGVSGPIGDKETNSSINMTAYALTYLNQIDTSFSGSFNLSGPMSTVFAPSSGNFSSGQANFTVQFNNPYYGGTATISMGSNMLENGQAAFPNVLPVANQVSAYSLSSFDNNNCQPILVSLTGSGDPGILSANTIFNLGTTGSGGFFTSNSCSGGTSTLTFPTGSNFQVAWYKATAGGAPNLSFSFSSGQSISDGSIGVSVGSGTAGAISHVRVVGPTAYRYGSCVPYMVVMTDTAQNARPVGASTTITLSGGGNGTFYADDACGTTLTSNQLTIGTGGALNLFWYRAPVNGTSDSITIQGTDGSSTAVGLNVNRSN